MSLLCFSVLHNFTRGTFSDVFFFIYTFMIFRKIWMGVYFIFCVNWTWFRLIYRLCSPTALFTQIQSHQDHKFFRRTVHTPYTHRKSPGRVPTLVILQFKQGLCCVTWFQENRSRLCKRTADRSLTDWHKPTYRKRERERDTERRQQSGLSLFCLRILSSVVLVCF